MRVAAYVCVWVGGFICLCGCGHTVCSVLHSAYICSDTQQPFLAPTQPNKDTSTRAPSPPVCATLLGSLPCCESSAQLVQENTHAHINRWQTPIKLRADSQHVHGLSDIWSVPQGLQHILSTPAKTVTAPPSLPQVVSLELTCYLCASRAWSSPMAAQRAPSVESHTPRTHMPVSLDRKIGQEAKLETPLLSLSWCPSFSCSLLLSTNTHPVGYLLA